MSKEKQIEERNELVDLLQDIGHDWDAYIDECQENEEEPQLSYEDFHADGILEAGYRKQSDGEWIYKEDKDDFFCSICGSKALCDGDCIGIDWIMQELSDYCPHCGAKMKGGAE